MPESPQIGIPVTYVPARNTVMLSFALGWAEVLSAPRIFIGVNAVDYSGYPDCRPAFVAAFERVANLATKAGVEGTLAFEIATPLIDLTKAQIIRRGIELGVDFSLTVSCYQADAQGRACGRCDACRLRRDGFKAAGVPIRRVTFGERCMNSRTFRYHARPARSQAFARIRGSVAQSVEHWTFNPLVVGSIPTRPTKPSRPDRHRRPRAARAGKFWKNALLPQEATCPC